MSKRVLKVCLASPWNCKKGDSKLVRERSRALNELGHWVDVLYFRMGWLGRSNIILTKANDRRGYNIKLEVSLVEIIYSMAVQIKQISRLPIQTWLSCALRRVYGDRLSYIVSAYKNVHVYHLRSVGLWSCVQDDTNVVIDLIDSYTLNIRNRLEIEKSLLKRLVLSEELRRVEEMEQDIGRHIKSAERSTIATVSQRDLELIGGSCMKRLVIPVGIELNKTLSTTKDYRRFEALRCIFFGNLDYEPNVSACGVLIEVVKMIKDKGLDERMTFTVGGRNVSKKLRKSMERSGIRVISPVGNMESLVRQHNIAVLPMISGSGMQSKVLEAIAWDCLVVATNRTVVPLALSKNNDYIEAESPQEICEALVGILEGDWDTDVIRENAVRKIGRFEWKLTCERISELYD